MTSMGSATGNEPTRFTDQRHSARPGLLSTSQLSAICTITKAATSCAAPPSDIVPTRYTPVPPTTPGWTLS